MGESNTVVSAYTLYRHLQQYCSHPSICAKFLHSCTINRLLDRVYDYYCLCEYCCVSCPIGCYEFYLNQKSEYI